MRRPFYVLVFLFGAMVIASAGLLYWAERQATFPTIAGGELGAGEEQVAATDAPDEALPDPYAPAEPEPGERGAEVSEQPAGPESNAMPESDVAAEESASEDEIAADGGAPAERTAGSEPAQPSDALASLEDLGPGDPAPDIETETEIASGPAFDVVRVEPNGEALMAGRAEPNTDIEVLAGDEVIARGTTDADGAFLVIPEEPLEPGNHEVTVRQAGTEEAARPEQQVAVVIPAEGGESLVGPAATAEAEEPEQQIAALEPENAEPAEAPSEPAAAGQAEQPVSPSEQPASPAEQPADHAAIPGQPEPGEDVSQAPAVDLSEVPAALAGEASDPVAAETPAIPTGAPEAPVASTEIAEVPQQAPVADEPSLDMGLAGQDEDEAPVSEQDIAAGQEPAESVEQERTDPAQQPQAPAAEQELASVPEQEQASRAEEDVATPSAELATTPVDPVTTEPESPVAAPVLPANPWIAELATVPPGLTAGDRPAEPEETVSAEAAGGEGATEPESAADPEIATAPTSPVGQPDSNVAERDRPADAETEIAAAQAPAGATGLSEDGEVVAQGPLPSNGDLAVDSEAVAGQEGAPLPRLEGTPAATGAAPSADAAADAPPDETESEPMGEQDVAALQTAEPDDAANASGAPATPDAPAPLTRLEGTEGTIGDTVAPSAAIDLTAEPELAIRAAEAEAQTLYVAGEAAPGTMVRIYADEEFVGQAEAGEAGNWLLEAQRDIPVGEVTLRADAVASDVLNPVAQAELPFIRYADGVVLEPVAVASADGQEPVSVSANVPPPAFIIIRRGDNLWHISRRNYGRGIRYHAIFEANQDRIRDPDLIYPGQVFVVPERDLSWETATN